MGGVPKAVGKVVTAPVRKLFGSDAAPKPPPLPAAPAPVPTLTDVDAGAAASLEKSLARTRKGRRSTFLGDMGIIPGDAPKTFLGGGG